MRKKIEVFLCACLLCICARPVSADEWYTFVQVTCIPEMQYFSLRSFGQYNTPSHIFHDEVADNEQGSMQHDLFRMSVKKRISELEKRYGLYTAESLAKKPFVCSLPNLDGGVELDARVTAKYRAPAASGQGAGTPDEMINVTVNGKDLGVINLQDWSENLITASGNDATVNVRKCTINVGAPVSGWSEDDPTPSKCSRYDFR